MDLDGTGTLAVSVALTPHLPSRNSAYGIFQHRASGVTGFTSPSPFSRAYPVRPSHRAASGEDLRSLRSSRVREPGNGPLAAPCRLPGSLPAFPTGLPTPPLRCPFHADFFAGRFSLRRAITP